MLLCDYYIILGHPFEGFFLRMKTECETKAPLQKQLAFAYYKSQPREFSPVVLYGHIFKKLTGFIRIGCSLV